MGTAPATTNDLRLWNGKEPTVGRALVADKHKKRYRRHLANMKTLQPLGGVEHDTDNDESVIQHVENKMVFDLNFLLLYEASRLACDHCNVGEGKNVDAIDDDGQYSISQDSIEVEKRRQENRLGLLEMEGDVAPAARTNNNQAHI